MELNELDKRLIVISLFPKSALESIMSDTPSTPVDTPENVDSAEVPPESIPPEPSSPAHVADKPSEINKHKSTFMNLFDIFLVGLMYFVLVIALFSPLTIIFIAVYFQLIFS